VLLGLLLVGVGTAMLVDRASSVDGGAVFTPPWWLPFLVVLAGCVRLVWFVRQPWESIRAAVIILAGVLLGAFGLAVPAAALVAGHYGPFLWPAALIVTGAWITVGGRERRATSQPEELRESVWLRGDACRPTSCAPTGRIRVVLGYLLLDLRGCGPEGLRCELDLTVALGHIRILVPEGVTVDRRPAFVVASHGLQYQTVAPEPEVGAQLIIHVIGILGDAVITSDVQPTTHTGSTP